MDAHDPEYLAAAEGMADTYGQPRHDHAVGDLIWFRLADATYPQSGRVAELLPMGAYRVEADNGGRHVVWGDDIVRV